MEGMMGAATADYLVVFILTVARSILCAITLEILNSDVSSQLVIFLKHANRFFAIRFATQHRQYLMSN